MPTVEDFTGKQRLASARIIEALGRIAATKDDFTQTVLQSVAAVLNAPGGEAGRAQEAVRLVGPALQAIERSLEEEVPGILAAIAELSENWDEHQRLWDALKPSELSVVLQAEESIAEQQESLVSAKESDRTFKESLENFAAIGAEPAAAARGVIVRLEGIMTALDEHAAHVQNCLGALRVVARRLEGSSS